jgi:thymidylate kinase
VIRKAKLLVFEGVDGVGKSTFSRSVAEWLQSQGEDVVHLSFPGREPRTLSQHVYALHHDPTSFEIDSLHPASRQILHVAAHVEVIENRIRPAIAKGQWVILDRFWWSMVAYGRTAGVDNEALWLLARVEATFWRDIRPVLVFYLERRSQSERTDPTLLSHYEDLLTHESTNCPVVRINNEGTVQETFGFIRAKCEKLRSAEGYRVAPNFSHAGLERSAHFPTVFTKLSPVKTTAVYDTYWRFAAERQAIFFRRFHGEPSPWTDDAILREHKFTNAYRASDRTSQYLIKHVIYTGDQSAAEVGFRILLFKLFNKIDTWELLTSKLGELLASTFKFEHYDNVLSAASDEGRTLYSGAYIMPSGGAGNPGCKHKMHLRLLSSMIRDNAFDRIANMKTMRQAFELLRAYPSFGDFLAYQYITDINYSEMIAFTEMEFVMPGPGAKDGIKKCFSDLGGLCTSDIIRVVADRQDEEFARLGIVFQNLWGRPLQLIDCQNLFCEVDKYARVKHPEIAGLSGRTRIKQKFRHRPLGRVSYWYPPKWKLNDKIKGDPHVFDF